MQDFVHQPYEHLSSALHEAEYEYYREGKYESSNTGLLSNQGEKSINFYFIRVPLRKKVLK